MRGSSESAIFILGRVLACAVSGVNKVTDDFGADSSCLRKQHHSSVVIEQKWLSVRIGISVGQKLGAGVC